MNGIIEKKGIKLQWMSDAPSGKKRIALLIPQYNEAKNGDLLKRLNYFMILADQYKDLLDVIIIDDGSTDNSFREICHFIDTCPGAFYFASVKPNAMKVGALYMAAAAITHEYVILSDFDTDLVHLEKLTASLDALNNDTKQIGCYFKMIPFAGEGYCFLLQQLEYSFARMYYKFHNREKSVPVMPGAGSCFKRKLLLDVYYWHSGFRNGEDRETTVLGLKMGLKTSYAKEVLALTRPPLRFKTLLAQRKRWYLGYIETFFKEKAFYIGMLLKGRRMGIRTLQDALGVVLLLLLPLELLLLFFTSVRLGWLVASGTYLLSVVYYAALFLSNKDERTEIKQKNAWLIGVYPLFWLAVSFLAWWNAVCAYRKKDRYSPSPHPAQVTISTPNFLLPQMPNEK